MTGDTIASAATPAGISGLAVLRLSGPSCSAAVQRCLGRKTWRPRHLHTATFCDPQRGEILDQVTFHLLPGPRSPTGEDVLEIFCHGNPLLVESLLRVLCGVPDVRLAEPGEFTRRALENGKIDLVQAEAVGEMVHAQNRAALRNAQRLLQGELSWRFRTLRDALVDLSARLELDADFAEEEADPDYASWRPRLGALRAEMESLLQGCERSRAWRRVPRAVVYGAPNAGKSSLINALAAQDRLLVSEAAGTTRDFVEVPLRVESGVLHLIDTAGLGRPIDALDAQAMDRTRAQLAQAELRIYVVDGAAPIECAEADQAQLKVAAQCDRPGFAAPPDFMVVSAHTGAGLRELLHAVEIHLFPPVADGEDVLLATERQAQALGAACDRLRAAEENLATHPAVEIVAFEVREAGRAVRELLGDVTPEAVLQRLFAGFCIGK